VPKRTNDSVLIKSWSHILQMVCFMFGLGYSSVKAENRGSWGDCSRERKL